MSVVLICDGDEADRSELRRSLEGFEVVEVSPAAARDALAARPFDAVIGDQLELMQHVRVAYPRAIRFLVSGDRELETVTRAVNAGEVHRYFQKPWDGTKLRAALDGTLRDRKESA